MNEALPSFRSGLLALTLPIVAGAILLGACGSTGEVETNDPAPVEAQLTTQFFGDDVDPQLQVATVGDAIIRVHHVAAYLRMFPLLSVEQAVEDLIDQRLLADMADAIDDEFIEHARLDGEIRGLALAWIDRELWQNEALMNVSDADVDEWLADPQYIHFYGIPALRYATHILVRVDAELATPADWTRAESLSRELHDEVQETSTLTYGGLIRVRDAHETDFEDGAAISIIVDAPFWFPQRYSGPPQWDGTEEVVPEFADAAFGAAVGELIGPVRTDFGFHSIVVLDTQAEELLSPEARRERIRSAIRSQRIRMAAAPLMAELTEGARIVIDPDVAQLLLLDPVARSRFAAEQMAGSGN